MSNLQLSLFAALMLSVGNACAQLASMPTNKTDIVPTLSGLNLVEGKDKKMHLIIDGQRIGSVQVDRESAKSITSLSIIPPQYWEPPVKKPFKPRDPCIYAAAGGKCVPDFTKQEPLIKFSNDVREMGVFVRKQ
jgi:hypothetical protein